MLAVCLLCVYTCCSAVHVQYECVCVCVLAEAERVGQKCERSAANRSSMWMVENLFLLSYKSTHTCEP